MTMHESFFSFLTSSLGIAIIAAIIAAFSTHLFGIEREKRREKKIKDEQRNSAKRIFHLIRSEIQGYLETLYSLQEDSNPNPIISAYPELQIQSEKLEKIMSEMKALRKSYLELPIDTRVRMFDIDALGLLDVGYRYYDQLFEYLQYKVVNRIRDQANNVNFSYNDLVGCIKHLELARSKLQLSEAELIT